MARQLQRKRFALVISPAAARQSILGKETPDVQTPIGSLRPCTSAGDAISEGGPSVGSAHWVGARSSQELAAHGVRISGAIGGLRCGAHLAIDERYRNALGGRG